MQQLSINAKNEKPSLTQRGIRSGHRRGAMTAHQIDLAKMIQVGASTENACLSVAYLTSSLGESISKLNTVVFKDGLSPGIVLE